MPQNHSIPRKSSRWAQRLLGGIVFVAIWASLTWLVITAVTGEPQ